MTSIKNLLFRFVCVYIFGLVIIGTIGLAYLGSEVYIADSEIWSVTLAVHYIQDWPNAWVITRPLFYALLALVVPFGENSVSIFLLAKWLCIVNGIAIVCLTYRLARILVDKALPTAFIVPLLSMFFLITNTGFLSQGHRIRADLFACTLVLLALERTIAVQRGRARAINLWIWILPVFATPKAILQMVPALAFISRQSICWSMIHLRKVSLGWRALLSGAILSVGVFCLLPIYSNSFQYFMNSFSWGGLEGGASYYWSKIGFAYLWLLFERNWYFFALVALRGISIGCRLASNAFSSFYEREIQRRFLVFCSLDLLVAIAAPERSPFFLTALFAPLAIFVALLCEDLWVLQDYVSARLQMWIRGLGFVIVLFFTWGLGLNGWNHYVTSLKQDNHQDEFTLIRFFESYMASYPLAQYYDVIGILPRRASLRHFVGPSDPIATMGALQAVLSHLPEVILYTDKCSFLEPELSQLLKTKYIDLGQGAFGRWEELPKALPINKHLTRALQPHIARLRAMTGAVQLPLLHFELLNRKGERLVVEAKPADLVREYYGMRVIRISAFTRLVDPPPLRLSQVFRFDPLF